MVHLSINKCHAVQWERVKRQGMAPSVRASFGMATHRRRAVLFGGVTDRAGRVDRISSELHSEAYTYNLDSRRWFPLALRLPAEDRSAAREVLRMPLARCPVDCLLHRVLVSAGSL